MGPVLHGSHVRRTLADGAGVPWFRRRREAPVVNLRPAVPVNLPGGRGAGLRVAGISYHQPEVMRVLGPKPRDGYQHREVVVDLVPEPTNPYDPQAVAVHLDGVPVGHLHREDLPRSRPIVLEAIAVDRHATCRAEVVGGWDHGPGDNGTIGLRLFLGDPRQETPPPGPEEHRLVPSPGEAAGVTVVGEEDHQDTLSAALHGRPLDSWLPRLVGLVPAGESVEVHLDGAPVGRLTPAMARRYLPLIHPPHAAGRRVTCIGEMHSGHKGGETIIRVRLSLPKVGE